MGKRWSVPAVLLLALTVVLQCAAAAQERRAYVYVNGEYVVFDQQPYFKNNVTMVPVRKIFELLGATVNWQGGAVVATDGETTITLRAGSPMLYKNGERILLDAAPELVEGRMMAPVRAVSELFGCTVEWDGTQGKVGIQTADCALYAPALEREAFALVNGIRMTHGLPPFLWDDGLQQVARRHSKDMYTVGFFAHNGSDGRSPFERMRVYGIAYSYAAENIAKHYDNACALVDGWMQSEAHRANILNGNLGRMGVGYYGGYWTQDFAN